MTTDAGSSTRLTPEERLRRRTEAKVRHFMDAASLWPAGARLVVALSGGPDSTALLLALHRLARKRPLDLHIAYFDHRLRSPAERAIEASAVASLAEELALPLHTGSADVRAIANQRHLSLEASARGARYAFLAEAAAAAGAATVATGHTAGDQAETVLMHILRGSGVAGLAGMAPVSTLPAAMDLTLVRPLLCLTRAETEAYCRAAGVEPVVDASNHSMAFLRNRLRHEVLPALRQVNPRVDTALVRLAEAARDDTEAIDALVAAEVQDKAGVVSISRETLSSWPSALRRQALRRALASSAGDAQGFSQRHILALERLVLAGRTGDNLDLPRGIVALLTPSSLELRGRADVDIAASIEAVCLSVPGEARSGSWRIGAARGPIEADATVVEADAAAVGNRLVVRSRRDGDRMQPAGMVGSKKLQDLFVDAKVPRRERDSVPVFENDRGIVWVGGLRLAEWARPRAGAPTVFLSYVDNEQETDGT